MEVSQVVAVVKNLPANGGGIGGVDIEGSRDTGWIPGSGRSPGVGGKFEKCDIKRRGIK